MSCGWAWFSSGKYPSRARIARWDGSKFVPATDWFSANQDVVWEEVRKYSEEFKKTGK